METWAEDEMCNEYMDIYYDLQSWLDKEGSEASRSSGTRTVPSEESQEAALQMVPSNASE